MEITRCGRMRVNHWISSKGYTYYFVERRSFFFMWEELDENGNNAKAAKTWVKTFKTALDAEEFKQRLQRNNNECN